LIEIGLQSNTRSVFHKNQPEQRGPNTGTRAVCGPRAVIVWPANAFSMP